MDERGSELILNWFNDIEGRFASLIQTVPISDDTRDVFIPPLTSIILEACSLLDTVFRSSYEPASEAPDAKFPDFARCYEERLMLSQKKTVVYHYPAHILRPFDGWIDDAGEYSPLFWWQNYNSIKHDRINNCERSTFNTALHSLCALHQAIVFSSDFVEALARHNMISFDRWAEPFAMSVLKGELPNESIRLLVESELFGTPTGGEYELPDDLSKAHWFGEDTKFRRFVNLGRGYA